MIFVKVKDWGGRVMTEPPDRKQVLKRFSIGSDTDRTRVRNSLSFRIM